MTDPGSLTGREDVEIVREALRALTPFGSGGEIATTYADRGRAALARLEARLAEVEKERDLALVTVRIFEESQIPMIPRAAATRIAELEGALRGIRDCEESDLGVFSVFAGEVARHALPADEAEEEA